MTSHDIIPSGNYHGLCYANPSNTAQTVLSEGPWQYVHDIMGNPAVGSPMGSIVSCPMGTYAGRPRGIP